MSNNLLEEVRTVREELVSLDRSLENLQRQLEEENEILDLETNTENVAENGVLGTIERGLFDIWAPLSSIGDFLLPYLEAGMKSVLTFVTSIFTAVSNTLDKLADLIKKLDPFLTVMKGIQANLEALITLISPRLALMDA